MQPYKYDKVLVIDDTELDCFIARKMMRLTKFAKDTVCINSAMAALHYLNTLTDNPNALPDLIFLDVNMPGMSGFQFLCEYKKLPLNLKKKSIIMLTSSMLEEDKAHAMSSEYVRSFMNKPLTMAGLDAL